jgi:hypothetical protein
LEEEEIMRYMLALVVAVGMGVAAVVPAALAFPSNESVNQFGNQVVPLQDPGGNGGGTVYVDGVARSSVQPAKVTLYPASGLGTVAGGGAHDVSVDAARGMEGSNR